MQNIGHDFYSCHKRKRCNAMQCEHDNLLFAYKSAGNMKEMQCDESLDWIKTQAHKICLLMIILNMIGISAILLWELR